MSHVLVILVQVKMNLRKLILLDFFLLSSNCQYVASVGDLRTWDEAFDICHSLFGMTLATVQSEEEQLAVMNMAKSAARDKFDDYTHVDFHIGIRKTGGK